MKRGEESGAIVRLWLPVRFNNETDANSCIEASGLFPIGFKAVVGKYGRWCAAMDVTSERLEKRLAFMAKSRPSINWALCTNEP